MRKEQVMPHVTVKLLPGRTEEQKARLANAIVEDVVTIAKCDEESVSVAIEEVKAEDWDEKVYRPEILPNRDRLYKKPGYDRR
jgi:4-oxalocrotonate tautomerase